MEYVIGLVVGLIFCIFLALAFYAGYRMSERKKPAEVVPELTEKQREELKRRNEGLNNIMNYDMQQAMGVKYD
jgi:hypothetical protein